MPGRLMTAAEALAEFGIPSVSTLRTMRAKGLPSVKLGKAHLFHSEDIEAFIQNAKVVTRLEPAEAPVQQAAQAVVSLRASTDKLRAIARKNNQRSEEPDTDALRTKPYSVAALADHWGTSTTAIYNLINAGLLPSFKLGGKLIRIKPKVVEEYERRKADQAGR